MQETNFYLTEFRILNQICFFKKCKTIYLGFVFDKTKINIKKTIALRLRKNGFTL